MIPKPKTIWSALKLTAKIPCMNPASMPVTIPITSPAMTLPEYAVATKLVEAEINMMPSKPIL